MRYNAVRRDVTQRDVLALRRVASHRIASHHSHHITSHHITSHHITRQYNHVHAPNEAPCPSDEKERHANELHHAYEKVDEDCSCSSSFSNSNAWLSEAKCAQPAQNGSCQTYVHNSTFSSTYNCKIGNLSKRYGVTRF